jgi:hypothetical protein
VNNRTFPRPVSIIVASGLLCATTDTPAFTGGVFITHRLLAELAVTEAVASCARQGYGETAAVLNSVEDRQDRGATHCSRTRTSERLAARLF